MESAVAMPFVQVKKVVAVCFLEAVKLALDQLGAHRLELSQRGVTGTADLPRVYGELRRLRDFLQRSVSSSSDIVDLDLSPGDTGMLVACCRRDVEATELRLVDQAMPPDERTWLQRKRQVVADWAVELAAKPLIDLPLPPMSPTTTEGMRALSVRLQNKVFGDVNERMRIVPPSSSPSSPSFSAGLATPMSAEPVLQGQHPLMPSASADSESTREPVAPLFPHGRIRDPRLRSLAGIELHSYERALMAGDIRLATVLLTSVLECALLDHAVPRRAELGLQGTPDTWNLQELLLKAMGTHVQPKDASLAYHLFSTRNLLRPALQMVTPAVVTQAAFERLREFVVRALRDIGYGEQRATLPPGALRRSDFGAPADPAS